METSAIDKALIAIRPLIPQAIVDENSSEGEAFQNLTLRPILKLLNNTLLLSTQAGIIRMNKQFARLSKINKATQLKIFLHKNQQIKAILQGHVVGLMSSKELMYYHLNFTETNKRIQQMLEVRIFDQLDFFD